MKAYTFNISTLTISLMILLVGCANPVNTQSSPLDELALASRTPTNYAIPETATQTPSPVVTSFATLLPTNTSTSLPPTWTPLPTLSTEEAQNLLNDLLDKNAGCRLPCFWGIIPGKTTWPEASNFLATFTSFDITDISKDIRIIEPLIPFPIEKVGTIRHYYEFNKGVVDEINVYNADLAPALYLFNFLNTYGPPNEVWIRTQAIEEQGSQPFEVALFYPDQGILMDYSGGNLTTVGDDLRNCLGNDLDSPFILLWNSTEKLSFDQAIARLLHEPYDDPFLPLEEAAGMDVKTFYENFKDPKSTACLVTPKRLWPGGQ
jgi:hypothetical protein